MRGSTALKRRAVEDEQLVVEIVAAHKRSRVTYGSPRVYSELRARGVRVGRKRIEWLMRERGIQARHKRCFRRTTDSKHAHPVAPNVLARKFSVKSANAVWVTDVTCIWTADACEDGTFRDRGRGDGWLRLERRNGDSMSLLERQLPELFQLVQKAPPLGCLVPPLVVQGAEFQLLIHDSV